MPPVTLRRTEYLPEGTFGRLLFEGLEAPIFTIELPWRQNHAWTREAPHLGSCIPEGAYTCRPRWYNAGDYQAVEVCDVPGRTHILFHKGRKPADLGGCIAMGLVPWYWGEERGVQNSAGAWNLFRAAGYVSDEDYEAPPFELEVTG
jgi:hypothetical protein